MTTILNQPELDDQTFIARFESQTLNPAHFTHVGHLRLAWLYLSRNDLDRALALVSSGIKAYAESQGAFEKFHLTITDALVRIIDCRMRAMKAKDWLSFLKENQDLVEDAQSILLEHFSRDSLFSDQARTSLVAPDRKPL